MIELIPAIDIIESRCVRLYQGDYNQKTEYSDNPVEVAHRFEQAGISYLHLVDLDGARQKQPVNMHVLKEIANQTQLLIDYGGGINTTETVEEILKSGAQKITAGSIAVREPQLMDFWLRHFGADKLILGADVHDGRIAVSGWQERTTWKLMDFIAENYKKGFRRLICTDISKDGALKGPAVKIYKEIKQSFPQMFVIASGGVASMRDIENLSKNNIDGVIFGKAFYEGRISLNDLEAFLC